MVKKRITQKLTARERRNAEKLKVEIKGWATVLRCSHKRIRAAIEAGTLVFKRGRLWISNSRRKRQR